METQTVVEEDKEPEIKVLNRKYNTDKEYLCDMCGRMYSRAYKFCPHCGMGG